MRWISIVGAIGLAGCITKNVTKTGPFVRDIQSGPGTFNVVSCVVQVETTTNYTWWLIGENASKDMEVTQGPCWQQPLSKAGL